VSYAKLYSTITTSSLWSEAKEVRLLFVSMLANADSNGFVEVSLPGLARMANLTTEEVNAGVLVLEEPDVFSKSPEHDGRRILKVPGGWVILNYEDYRNRRSDEERREYMRKYMRDYRKQSKPALTSVNTRKPTVNHGKPPLAHTEGETEGTPEGETDTTKSRRNHMVPLSPLPLDAFDWEAAIASIEMVARKVPPRSKAERRNWLRFAVLSRLTFSEDWLQDSAEAAVLAQQQQRTTKSLQSYYVGVLRRKARDSGIDGDSFSGMLRRIEIPANVWNSSALEIA
jgi:hypothetical protein